MIGSYAQLKRNSYPFLRGTQFKIENEDDGMWSLYAFFQGPTKDGEIVTCEWNECDLIEDSEYIGTVFKDDSISAKNGNHEQWWEFTKYP